MAYEIMPSLVGSEMCIRDSINADYDGGGEGSITQTGGNFLTNTLYATAPGEITLTQDTNDLNYLNADSTVSGNILFSDTDDINLTDINTLQGNINISAGGIIIATDVQAGKGSVNLYTTTGGMELLNVFADNDVTVLAESGNITINNSISGNQTRITSSAGSITEIGTDAGIDITAHDLILSATEGIGSADNAIETGVDNLDAVNTNNNIHISNTGKLTLVDLNTDAYGINNINGSTTIIASSPLTIASTISSGKDITLQATENGGDDDNITVSADVLSTDGGMITFNAGADFLQTSGTIVTAGGVNINADYDGGGEGNIIQTGGSVNAGILSANA